MPINRPIKTGTMIWYMDHVHNTVQQAKVVGFETLDECGVYLVTTDYVGATMKKPLLTKKHVFGEWVFETEFEAKECLKEHLRRLIDIKRQQILDLTKKLRSL